MTVSFKWLGHSAFSLDIDGHKVLIDPFLTGNPLAVSKADEIDADVILMTHAHGDHVGDSVDIAKRTGATIVCNHEMGIWYAAQGVENVFQGNAGGTYRNDWMDAKWTVAFHSSSFSDGTYGGQPNGFVIRGGGKTLYNAGDTSLFSDMSLIGDEDLDVAFLPIGDVFTMGLDDSVKATKLLNPKYVVPMHYNTFPPIQQNVTDWAEMINRETKAIPIIVDPNGEFTVE